MKNRNSKQKKGILWMAMVVGFLPGLHAQNVGIGTNTPEASLDVRGNLNISPLGEVPGNLTLTNGQIIITNNNSTVPVMVVKANMNSHPGIILNGTNSMSSIRFSVGENINQDFFNIRQFKAVDFLSSFNGPTQTIVTMTSQRRVGIANLNPNFSLDVTGDVNIRSTGLLRFNGNSGTSGALLTSNGDASPSWVGFRGFSARMPSSQSVASGSDVKLNFTNENFNEGNNYNLVLAEYTAPEAGFYLMEASIVASNVPIGNYSIKLTNASILPSVFVSAAYRVDVAGFTRTFQTQKVVRLTAGDKVSAYLNHNAGSSVSVFNGAGTYFTVVKLR
jgi:hypothetical protein